MIREILVPFNGSDTSHRTAEIGAGLARAAGLPLRIFAYTDKPDIPAHSKALYDCVASIRTRHGVSPQTTSVPTFRFLSDELLSQSARRPGSVICIPSLGLGRRALLSGSLATDVLTYNPGPTVLVGPECDVTIFEHGGPIVIALDGSHESEAILPAAHEWAQTLDRRVELISVLSEDLTPAAATAIASGDILESGYVAQVAHDSPIAPDHPNFDVRHGKPAKEIVRASRECEASMIAMSSSVPLGVDRLLHGSVLDEVARHSPVPILALGQHVGESQGRGKANESDGSIE